MKKHITILMIIFAFITNAYNQNCQALFTSIPDSVSFNIYSFIDQSTSTTGNIISWSWTFQNGVPSTSALQNPGSITWSSTGAYYICLTIYTNDSCSSTFCDSIYINITPPPCSGFYFNPQITPDSMGGIANGAINLNVYGGTVPYTYLWNTGDSTENLMNIPNGNYCVTVTDNIGCEIDTCLNVPLDTVSTCNTDFQIMNAYCPNCFGFIDSSTASGSIISWYWDFGDGNYSTLQNTEHVYLDSAYYQVCLTITTSDSCMSIHCDSVYAQYNLESFSVSGQVFHDSTLLSSGTVELYEVSLGNNHPALFSETITNGSYLFNDVVSGNYKMLAIPDPPTAALYASTYYGNVTDWSSAYTLPVFSELISVDINLQTSSGIDEMNTSSLLHIFPNPFTNNLNINSEDEIKSIIIYDITGAIIYIKNPPKRKISISTVNLHKGIYLISIELTHSVYQQKLIKL